MPEADLVLYDRGKPWADAMEGLARASVAGDVEAAARLAAEAERLGCRTVDQWFTVRPEPLFVVAYRCAECRRVFGADLSARRIACFVNAADGRHWQYDRPTTDPPKQWGWRGRWAAVEERSVPVSFEEPADG